MVIGPAGRATSAARVYELVHTRAEHNDIVGPLDRRTKHRPSFERTRRPLATLSWVHTRVLLSSPDTARRSYPRAAVFLVPLPNFLWSATTVGGELEKRTPIAVLVELYHQNNGPTKNIRH